MPVVRSRSPTMRWLRGCSKFCRFETKEPMPATPSDGGHSIRRGPVNVAVGLDFGTHSTKAVFFELGAGARIFRPVNFRHGLARWPGYTLPGIGTIRNGALVWGSEAAALLEKRPWNEGIRRLKVLVAAAGGGRFGDTALHANYLRELERSNVDLETWRPQHVVVAALALQMAEVRLRLEDHYGVRDFDAQFAIPVPIDQAQDSGVLALCQRVANATQRLLT